MSGQSKYAVLGLLGLALLVLGSILFAAVSSEGGENTFGRVFTAALGIALILLGVGTTIASAATYLARRE